MTTPEQMVSVRYMLDDVDAAICFYTAHLGFEVRSAAMPAFAEVTRGSLRLLLADPDSSAGRPMPDGHKPTRRSADPGRRPVRQRWRAVPARRLRTLARPAP